MTQSFTLALAQMNPTVGDLVGNAARIAQMATDAAEQGADLVLFPEMALIGYPPEDLVLVPAFRRAAMEAAQTLATQTRDLPCDIMFGSLWEESAPGAPAMSPQSGAPGWSADQPGATQIYNASLLASRGVLTVLRTKHDLPNYGVFDEKRVFDTGASPAIIHWRGIRLGILICEEVWDVALARDLAAQGAELLLVQNASPYHLGKASQRAAVVNAAVKETHLPIVYLNLVGGQDELVFDGRSYAVDAMGRDVARLPGFVEALAITKWEKRSPYPLAGEGGAQQSWEGEGTQRGEQLASKWMAPSPARGEGIFEPASPSFSSTSLSSSRVAPPARAAAHAPGGEGVKETVQWTVSSRNPTEGRRGAMPPSNSWHCTSGPMVDTKPDEETIYHALVLGLRDYVEKNKFPGIVLGLSGGIDSGVTAAIAVDALGPEKVHTIRLPSPFTSADSLEDADQLAAALGIRMDTVPITPLIDTARQTLAPLFEGRHADTTEENIQARLRGLLLMAVSNKFGPMVLTTGNKSEMSVGYATLYGDMCGGFSVLKDVYKTTVTKLSHWRNTLTADQLTAIGFQGAAGVVIPPNMIAKPPTAELRPNQRDEDSLPPYEVLDAILRGLIERQLSVSELVAEGMDKPTVERVARMVAAAEYKRRQSAPGVKITPMAFGRDRRWPITNAWKFA